MRATTVILAALVASCATVAERHPDEMRAACAAQEFLRTNGYLDELVQGPVALELMDGIGYGREDDSIDWARLGTDRRGSFSRRLAGVTHHSDGFAIFYNVDGPRAYVSASTDLSRIRVTHAPRRNQPEVRITENSLRCDRTS